MQNIQELTPEIAEKHGLSLKLWPMLNGAPNACPTQQISRLSLEESRRGTAKPQVAPAASQQAENSGHQRAAGHHHELDNSSGCGGTHDQQTAPSSSGPASLAADKPPAQATSNISEAKAQWGPSSATVPAAEAANGHPQAAGAGGAARDRGMRSSTGSEQQALSRGTCVPGHSWLPCPRLATPDAAESDYLTVSTSLVLVCSSAISHWHAMPRECGGTVPDQQQTCFEASKLASTATATTLQPETFTLDCPGVEIASMRRWMTC